MQYLYCFSKLVGNIHGAYISDFLELQFLFVSRDEWKGEQVRKKDKNKSKKHENKDKQDVNKNKKDEKNKKSEKMNNCHFKKW